MVVVSNQYLIKEQSSAKNSALAASSTEVVISGPSFQQQWNTLLVTNLDATTDIEVRLDADAARRYQISKGGGVLNIRPEDNIHFRTVTNVNLDAANAETVSSINFVATYSETSDGV